jgi:hypothetical protein
MFIQTYQIKERLFDSLSSLNRILNRKPKALLNDIDGSLIQDVNIN